MPTRHGSMPVRSAARAGWPIGFVVKAALKFAPCRASASRWGVETAPPLMPTSCALWSSERMSMMFGRSAPIAVEAATSRSNETVCESDAMPFRGDAFGGGGTMPGGNWSRTGEEGAGATR